MTPLPFKGLKADLKEEMAGSAATGKEGYERLKALLDKPVRVGEAFVSK